MTAKDQTAEIATSNSASSQGVGRAQPTSRAATARGQGGTERSEHRGQALGVDQRLLGEDQGEQARGHGTGQQPARAEQGGGSYGRRG